MKKLIKSVTVRDSKSNWNNQQVDILIENSTILEIGKNLILKDVAVIEGTNLEIYQKVLDGRVHFYLPNGEQRENWDELISSARKGGISSLRLFPSGSQPCQSPESVKFIQNKGKEESLNLIPVASLTIDNKEENFTDLYDLYRAGARFFTNGEGRLNNIDIMAKSLQYLAPYPVTIIVQPDTKLLSLFGQMHEGIESTYLGLKGIPSLSEEMAIKRDLDLLKYTIEHSFGNLNPEFKLHFTCISSYKSVELIKQAKKEGLPISADVSINNLCFTDKDLADFDVNKKVFPPLRSNKDQKALWNGLKEGIIDYIVSDHLPIEVEHKDVEFGYADFGSIGLETLFLAFKQNSEKFKLSNISNYLTYNQAEDFQIEIQPIEKGNTIQAIITEEKQNTYQLSLIKNQAKNSIFIGSEFKFQIKTTI